MAGPRADGHLLQGRHDVPSAKRKPGLQDRTLATPLIDDGQHPKPAPVEELIVHKVHAPALPRPRGPRGLATDHGRVLAASDAAPDLPFFQAVQPIDPILADPPPLPPEQDMNARVVKPGAGQGQVPDPHVEGGRVPGGALHVPGRS